MDIMYKCGIIYYCPVAIMKKVCTANAAFLLV